MYGIAQKYNKKEWTNIIRQLVSQNLLLVDIVEYGGLSITEFGIKFLREKQSLKLKKLLKKRNNS